MHVDLCNSMNTLCFYFLVVNFVGIFSVNNTMFNCKDYENYILEHNCTCEFFGVHCSASTLKLKGPWTSFINILTGNFSMIESIDVSENEDSLTITNSSFTSFFNLRSLRIHNSSVLAIETGTFRNLPRLEKLEITGNPYLTFDSITDGLNHLNSPSLKVLNISGSYNAEDLSLLGGFIRKPMFQFLSNTSLRVLDLSWSRLTTLLAPFNLLPHLEVLNVSGTLLLGTTNCISTLLTVSNISALVIDHWPFYARGHGNIRYSEEPHGLYKRSIPDDCEPVKYMSDKGCIISTSSFRTFQARYVDMDSFFLDFSNDICFEENNILNHIQSHSKVSKQIGAIYGYKKLKLFDLSYPDVLFEGPLIKLNMFYAMPALRTLRLAGFYLNRLEDNQIENLFIRNHNLTKLDISKNDLVKLPKNIFVANSYLEYLNVSWNKLSVFDPDLSACTHLKYVDLSYNNLINLESGVIQHLISLGRKVFLNINRNEFECSCELLDFVQNINVSVLPFQCVHDGEWKLITNNLSAEFVKNTCPYVSISNDITDILIGSIVGGIVGVLIIIIALVIICRRRKKPVAKGVTRGGPVVISLNDLEIGKENNKRNPKFIVFLAYCSKDYQFVLGKIYHRLNDKLKHFLPHTDPDELIIIYDKNFLAGIDIDEICRLAITESHVTVAIVTENFLDSPWCNLEVKMAISSKVPLLPLFVTKCEAEKLTGFLRIVYEQKVRLLWPETSALEETQAEVEENELLDTLCTHILTYVKLQQSQTN